MYHSNRNGDFVLGALVGGGIAVLTTLLFTTKKGTQIKNMVVEKCQQLEEELSNAKDEAVDTAHDAVKKGAQKLKKDE